MGFLAGKRFLITGGSEQPLDRVWHRACLLTAKAPSSSRSATQGERFKERIQEYAAEFGTERVFEGDVGEDAQIGARFANGEVWPEVRQLRARGRVRAARSDRGRVPRRPVPRGFRIAHDISGYSFPALAKAAGRACAPARRC